MRHIVALAGILALVAISFSSVAYARDREVVGTWVIADLGQGGWGAGPLYSDGSIGGGGYFSYGDGQNVGTITGTTWSWARSGPVSGPDAVNVCFTDHATKGQLLFPSPMCIIIPVTKEPVVRSLAPGPETLLWVKMGSG